MRASIALGLLIMSVNGILSDTIQTVHLCQKASFDLCAKMLHST